MCAVPEQCISYICSALLRIEVSKPHIYESLLYCLLTVLALRVGIQHRAGHKISDSLLYGFDVKHFAIGQPPVIPLCSCTVKEVLLGFCHACTAFLKDRIIEFHSVCIACQSCIEFIDILCNVVLCLLIYSLIRFISSDHLLIVSKCLIGIVIRIVMSHMRHGFIIVCDAVPDVRILCRILVVDILHLVRAECNVNVRKAFAFKMRGRTNIITISNNDAIVAFCISKCGKFSGSISSNIALHFSSIFIECI